ncbi:MAG: TolC family protein [Microscillaceae bacterium]|nr:TolC family protein [Microscillaceae bacterium]
MRFFFISCFLILGGGLLSKAYAQERPSNNVWSLEDCIQYAVKQNISIQQSELQIQIDENNYLQSKISRYPDANAFANQNFAWGRSIDPFTNQFVNQRVNSNNFSISSSVTLFDGLRIGNTIKRNQLNVDISRLDAEQARYDASLNVALAYLNILLNQELLEVARQNVLSTQAQLDRTLKLFEAGAVAENDVIDLRSTLATNELSVVNAENTLLLSKVSLQQLMNLPVGDDFEVVKVSVESLRVLDLAESSQQIYETSESFLPSVRRAQLAITRDEYNIEIAKAGRYPTLNLNGTIFSGYSSATTDFDEVINGVRVTEVGRVMVILYYL